MGDASLRCGVVMAAEHAAVDHDHDGPHLRLRGQVAARQGEVSRTTTTATHQGAADDGQQQHHQDGN